MKYIKKLRFYRIHKIKIKFNYKIENKVFFKLINLKLNKIKNKLSLKIPIMI